MLRYLILVCIALCSALSAVPSAYAQGKPNDIVVGHTYMETGFLALVGAQMKAGLEAAFAESNATGGIKGRQLRTIALDDAFDEEKFAKNVQRFVSDDKVLALVCPVGTPQISKLKPTLDRAHLAVVGAKAGAASARAYHQYVFFNHAGFNDEVEYLARQLSTIGIKHASVGYVTLAFGRDLNEGFKRSAEKYGITVDKSVPFGAAGEDASALASELASAKSETYLVLGGGTGATNFVKQLVRHGVKPTKIYAMSTLSVQEVVDQLGPDSDGIVVSQIMPSPEADKLPLVKQYQAALKRVSKEAPSAFGLEAYISGRVLVEALKRIKGPITRESIAASLANQGTLNLGGFFVTYNDKSHEGSKFVHLAIISKGRLRY